MLRTLIILILVAGTFAALPGQSARAQDVSTTDDSQLSMYMPVISSESATLCRFGVNKDIVYTDTSPGGGTVTVNISPLRIGWYLTYGAYSRAQSIPRGVAFMPTIRVLQSGDNDYTYSIYANHATTTPAMLKQAIADNPGAEWFIGNEPDRRTDIVNGIQQDESEPHIYAKAYHELYHFIKSEDPTATIIAGSIVQPTELRLKYLDAVLAAYEQEFGAPMPVDVWATHNFILNEVSGGWGADIPPGLDDQSGLVIGTDELEKTYDVSIFRSQIERFRQWLADNGYRDKPLYVSEYGVLFGPYYGYTEFTPELVSNFMNATFDYMLNARDPSIGNPSDDNRLVQRFSWFSIYYLQFNGDLFTQQGVQTPVGANYQAYAAKVPSQTDFYPVEFTAETVVASGGTEASALTLTARIANSGNVADRHSAIVRFYDGNPNLSGTQIGPDQAVQLAGCGQNTEVSVQWDNPQQGERNLFVVVEPLRSGRELNNANNMLNTTITVGASAVAPSAPRLDVSGFYLGQNLNAPPGYPARDPSS